MSRALLLALLLPTLAGCMEPTEASPASCDDLAALEPAGNLPLHALLRMEDDAMAKRMADAVGDPLTGPRHEDAGGPVGESSYETEAGHVSVVRIRHSADHDDLVLRYVTDQEWTPWDGSRMEADLRALHDALGLDVALEVREEGSRDATRWVALDQVAGGRPTDASVAVTVALQGSASYQEVSVRGLRDVSALGATMDDGDLADLGLRHAACAPGFSEPRLVEVGTRSRFLHDSLFREVTVSVDSGCERAEGVVWVDLQTGATTEPVLHDAHCG